jgi:hypothetical protein
MSITPPLATPVEEIGTSATLARTLARAGYIYWKFTAASASVGKY